MYILLNSSITVRGMGRGRFQLLRASWWCLLVSILCLFHFLLFPLVRMSSLTIILSSPLSALPTLSLVHLCACQTTVLSIIHHSWPDGRLSMLMLDLFWVCVTLYCTVVLEWIDQNLTSNVRSYLVVFISVAALFCVAGSHHQMALCSVSGSP